MVLAPNAEVVHRPARLARQRLNIYRDCLGWTTGSSNGSGAATSMKTSTCKIMAAGWRPGVGSESGLTVTTRSGPTKPWITPRRRRSIRIPGNNRTQPARWEAMQPQPGQESCEPPIDGEIVGSKRLEIRPPAAVEFGTLKKSEREDGQCSAWLVLSFRKGLETRNERQSIKLSNDSNRQKSRLFHALRGLKDGVHLSKPRNCIRVDSKNHYRNVDVRNSPILQVPNELLKIRNAGRHLVCK